MSFSGSLRGIGMAFGLGASLVLAGCGSGGAVPAGSNSGSGSGGTTAGITLTGMVHDGQQPIVGAAVNLYAAGTSGYGTGASSLLDGAAAVTTDSSGKFSMTNDVTCPSANAQVYIVAQGGSVGSSSNSQSMLMSALGSCSNLGNGTVANVNEASTVAAVYALAQFMTPGSTIVGTSSTNVTGLVNAFSTVGNLIDSSSGSVQTTTPAGNGTVPQTTINTLANIVAACVDSKVDAVCQQFFSLATPPGGTTHRTRFRHYSI